jgi:membrane protein involved in colicin uptake
MGTEQNDAAAQSAADAQKAAAEAQAAKDAAKAEKEAKKAELAKQREEQKAARKAEKEKAKADRAQAKLDAKAAKEQAKLDAKAAKEAAKQPEQNGVRRPGPETLCGKAWKIFDDVSQEAGAPASIGASMRVAKAQGLNEGNVRAEYARWRKFHGITGRIQDPATVASDPAAAQPQA